VWVTFILAQAQPVGEANATIITGAVNLSSGWVGANEYSFYT